MLVVHKGPLWTCLLCPGGGFWCPFRAHLSTEREPSGPQKATRDVRIHNTLVLQSSLGSPQQVVRPMTVSQWLVNFTSHFGHACCVHLGGVLVPILGPSSTRKGPTRAPKGSTRRRMQSSLGSPHEVVRPLTVSKWLVNFTSHCGHTCCVHLVDLRCCFRAQPTPERDRSGPQKEVA